MGFDIQRLAELLKLADEYRCSYRTGYNPIKVETKTLAPLFTQYFSCQVKLFDIETKQ